MRRAAVFVDTAALLALFNPRDELHSRAIEISGQLAQRLTPLITSEWVLAEFLGGAARRDTRTSACRIVERIRSSKHARIVAASRAGFRRAFDMFRDRADKDWSLVDCSSILICQDQTVEAVFTHDHHFEQAGFRLLL